MRWIKQGLIFSPADHAWAGSHAQVPTVLKLADRYRIYYADRNKHGKSYTTFIDVDCNNPATIIEFHKKPVIDQANPGTFDDEGVMPAYVIWQDNAVWMYYSGWNQRHTIPYHNAMGLAVSHDEGLSFQRMYDGPIMDRNKDEPYLAVTPTILQEDGLWRMWYISGLYWKCVEKKYEPVYVIKSATSVDGIDWQRHPEITIPQRHEDEAFSHPTVFKLNDRYHMYYCYRDSIDYRGGRGSYRMGYAWSDNAVNWTRDDGHAGIDVEQTGWDSEMIAYPYIIEDKGRYLMFYNGNGFGQSGLGYAILES